MTDPFVITITDKGVQRDFEATLQVRGYTQRFVVLVEEVTVYFERDEEGSFRAILGEQTGKQIDKELLESIAHAIEAVLA